MITNKEIIEKYSKTKVGKQLKDKMYEIGCPEEIIANTLSCLETDDKYKKMLKAFDSGVRTEQDILMCCVYIDRNMEIQYKKSVDFFL